MYITLQEIKAYVGDWSSTADDTLVENVLIPNVCALIDSYTHRAFEAAADSSRALHAVADTDGDTLYLNRDLCAITSVTNGDGVLVAAADYAPLPYNEPPYYALKLLASATSGWTYTDEPAGAIVIVGRWAYSISPPLVVKQAALRWCKHLYRQRDNEQSGADEPRMSNDGVWIMPQAMPKDVAGMLSPLVRRT